MGTYINPGNSGFVEISDSDYVDKTGLIRLINQTINKKNKLTCISRPRRFGKSYDAKMLTAYYDCSCDSKELFEAREIAEAKDYKAYMNQYNVICLDITGFISDAKSLLKPLAEVPGMIAKAIQDDLFMLDSEDNQIKALKSLNHCLIDYVERHEGKKFIFIIDEWDAMIREAKDDSLAQDAYLNLLRGWFKNTNFTPKVVAAAYMTGILPIKKDGSQSAISDFKEYSMLNPGKFAGYTGFSEEQVRCLCGRNQLDFKLVKDWYDGYELPGTTPIYNPYSVMNAVEERKCRSYWGKTSASEALTTYINMNFDGLQEVVAQLIAGEAVPVNTDSFQNDLERFKNKDDILTLLIHLGYLTFLEASGTVCIPNEEVRNEFRNFLTDGDFSDLWVRLINRSKKLLDDTIAGNTRAVAAAIEEIRREHYAPQFYNQEQTLRFIIKYAYLAAIGHYIKIEEMPSGDGIADVVFIPKPKSRYPALVIELKWNKSSENAIGQIESKGYTTVLKDYGGEILLVGINYDMKTKKHTCRIDRVYGDR